MTEIPESGIVTGIKFCTATVTTGCTLSATIETVNEATSVPTGTLYHANATGTVVVSNTDDNVIKTVTFPGNVPVNAGDCVAVVLRISSGTPSALQLRALQGMVETSQPFRYRIQTGTTTMAGTVPSIVFTYSTGDVVPEGGLPFSLTANLSLSTSTTPDEVGNKLTALLNCRSHGFVFRSGSNTNFKATEVILYDSANNVVAAQVLPPSLIIGMATENAYYGRWDTPVNLKKGRVYRLVVKPTTGTTWTNMLIKYSGFAARPKSFQELAVAFTSRVDAGAWSDDTDGVVNLALAIDKIYQPGGSFM